jgi:hypothetical protein
MPPRRSVIIASEAGNPAIMSGREHRARVKNITHR